MSVLGIDLGFTVVHAAIMLQGRPYSISLAEQSSELACPALVAYVDGEVYVGHAALKYVDSSPNQVISEALAYLGMKVEEVRSNCPSLPFTLESGASGEVVFHIGNKRISALEVVADILAFVKARAESLLGYSISQVVLTVPTGFSEESKSALHAAAILAGLEVCQLIDKASAAVLAYGLEQLPTQREIVVYDLGGRTCTVSRLNVGDGKCELLDSRTVNIGGRNIDEAIVDREQQTLDEHYDIRANCRNTSRSHLEMAEAAKIALEERGTFGWFVSWDQPDIGHQEGLLLLTKTRLHEIAWEVIKPTRDLLAQVSQQPRYIILAGGSSRLAAVESMSTTFCDRVLGGISPAAVASVGAAILGARLTDAQ